MKHLPLWFLAATAVSACTPGDDSDGGGDGGVADGGDGGAADGGDGGGDGAGDGGGGDGGDGADGGDGGDGGGTPDTHGTPPETPLPAPEFTVLNHEGNSRSRSDLLGHPTVMWFYPLAASAG